MADSENKSRDFHQMVSEAADICGVENFVVAAHTLVNGTRFTSSSRRGQPAFVLELAARLMGSTRGWFEKSIADLIETSHNKVVTGEVKEE